jgi:hypothetical protein
MRIQGLRLTLLIGAAVLLGGCAPQNPAIAALEPVDFPAPAAVEPGTQLGFGDAVWVEQASGGETYLLGVAVLDIVEGEQWIWKNYENGDELFGYTPYFVIVQRAWLDADEKYDVSLYPLLADGSPGYLMETDTFGSINPATCDDLGLGLPHLDDPAQRFDCLLAAAPNGSSITGVAYDGTFARESGNVDPTAYLEAPVVWSAAP